MANTLETQQQLDTSLENLTLEDRAQINALARQQNVSPRTAFKRALAISARVADEIEKGSRIIVEKPDKRLFELLPPEFLDS